ncbi:IclR family transcriptional regulator [Spirilliplanes yamanashiensis]|uniref:IclR family transcriptional regulator n=1 Tax=Spirilliplanes yamanashiensis TaxID=42233 RepID=A0A8J4DK88_9ACTN|nr:IclR family transcriptional regulator [Spirilliplanes yamanashiensis]MDP9818196.1 DNA-binding IclR family transcriptional regulator [Spirilliplanes yamanashiensis]GIJ05007.1 IclR family transcriptional regulator [Spirilliplanes yamanashiensis]
MTSKVIAILSAFGHGGAFSLTELARLTGMPVSTAHRLTNELVSCGMLERPTDGFFRVGGELRSIAGYARQVPPSFHDRARRVMDDLAAATGRCAVRLGMLENLRLNYLEKLPGDGPVAIGLESGRLPLHATAMGRVLLAFAPAAVVSALVGQGLPAYTPYTCTSPADLRHALAVTRLTRVAVCRHEYDLYTSLVAVPVFDIGGRIVAALEVCVSGGTDLRMVQPPLVVAGRTLTRDLQIGAGHNQLTIDGRRRLNLAPPKERPQG